MEEWKDLLLTMRHAECYEAEQLVFSEGVQTQIVMTLMI